ncbi:type I DNA topoisomerase [Candidatus Cerribacteria bacterium 'Amazon FNV 2010 28 9']|uniref:DNA topoisomerase 1 n=1 Tax=Candidatus Cerribacteria bacterium 'Amazon FNV 2010 28 9' TaxID=2081795 RepID=A0A317JN96_9BACT|nr:MAG: type I DNA topoisomerase [Candidatus Cerribacteria bacterium 'Amazon FNV 2010 28 9']
MNLVIVESPTKAKTLRRFLGQGYAIEASMGHIRDLPKSKLGIDVAHDFAPEYVKSEGKTKTITTLKKLSKEAEKIYLATDPDREGEAISWHILQLLTEAEKSKIKNSKSKKEEKFVRATFHEITKQAIMHAIEHPGELNMDLVDAQQARRVVDRLVGYYMSPVLWKKVRRGLSAGRVQSVALRLIVEREKEIQAFVPQEYWEIYVAVHSQQGTANSQQPSFTVQLWKVNDKEFAASKKEDVEPIVAHLESASYIVDSVDSTKRKRQSLPPFTTSTLQQAAANRLGFSSKRTMTLAQNLYEQGLITYHRTDSVNLATSAVETARSYIGATYGEKYLPSSPRSFQTKSKNAQEAHEAIRPTEVTRTSVEGIGQLDEGHQKLYDLIWRRFLACQMSEALYDQTTIVVKATPPVIPYSQAEGLASTGSHQKVQDSFNGIPQQVRDDKVVCLLKAAGSVLLFDGWTKLFPNKEDVELPSLTVGESLTKEKVEALQKFTQPKPRYNDASLVKTLEKLGIGRPSTYSSIISVLEIRGYVERIQKAFVPTSIGTTVCDFLVKNFPKELDYAFTAGMEDSLDAISRGEKQWVSVVKQFFAPFEKNVETVTGEAARAQIPVEEMGQACPLCHEGKLVIRTGRFGKFVSCSRYPTCTFTGKLIFKVDGVTCPECGQGEVRQRQGKRGIFFGCSRYPSCKWTSWQKPGTADNQVVMSYVANPPKSVDSEQSTDSSEKENKKEEKNIKQQVPSSKKVRKPKKELKVKK